MAKVTAQVMVTDRAMAPAMVPVTDRGMVPGMVPATDRAIAPLIMTRRKTNPPSLRQRLQKALWLLVLLPVTAIAETNWSDELAAIQLLQADGNVVQAVIDLEALHRQNPRASRLKLELAALYLQLNQPETAEHYLTEVLADPDLPVRVRINTQVLLIQAQEAQTIIDYQLYSHLEISAGQTEQSDSGYSQISGRAQLLFPRSTFYSTRQLITLRPLAQMTALSRHYPERDDNPWLGRLEGGLSAYNAHSFVQLSLGLQRDDTLSGWLASADYATNVRDVRVRLAHEQFWHEQGAHSDSLASASKAFGTRSRVSVFWEGEHRSFDTVTSTDHEAGIGLYTNLNNWGTEFNLVQSLTRDELALENRFIWQVLPDWRVRLHADLTDIAASNPLNYALSISLRWTPIGT